MKRESICRSGQFAKSGLNKAISDAAWGSLKQKVKILSERAGVLVHEAVPHFSSQECSECGYVSPTNRGVPRKHDKSTPEEPVARQGKSSALVGEPGNPKRVAAIGVI
jgi:putative transposase